MNTIKLIFFLSSICLISVSTNVGLAKSSLHIQINEDKINKKRSGLPVVQFYENTLALYTEARLAYSSSEDLTSLFALLANCSQKNIQKNYANFLADIVSHYSIAVRSGEIPRSAEIESILINHVIMIDKGDDKIINSINKRIGRNTGLKIKIYSDLEMKEILNISTSAITPLGCLEGFSSDPICSIDSYSPELISYIYKSSIYNLKKCMEFLNKMKHFDVFFNVHNYYANRLNLLLFKTWIIFKKENNTESESELFDNIPLSSIKGISNF